MNKFERLTGVNECRVIQVVEVKSLAGEGTTEFPHYQATEYYSFEGELLARRTHRDDLSIGIWHNATHPSNTDKESK